MLNKTLIEQFFLDFPTIDRLELYSKDFYYSKLAVNTDSTQEKPTHRTSRW